MLVFLFLNHQFLSCSCVCPLFSILTWIPFPFLCFSRSVFSIASINSYSQPPTSYHYCATVTHKTIAASYARCHDISLLPSNNAAAIILYRESWQRFSFFLWEICLIGPCTLIHFAKFVFKLQQLVSAPAQYI